MYLFKKSWVLIKMLENAEESLEILRVNGRRKSITLYLMNCLFRLPRWVHFRSFVIGLLGFVCDLNSQITRWGQRCFFACCCPRTHNLVGLCLLTKILILFPVWISRIRSYHYLQDLHPGYFHHIFCCYYKVSPDVSSGHHQVYVDPYNLQGIPN